MERELIELIHEYVKSNKNIDEFFAKTSIEIIVRYYKLQEYIKNLEPLFKSNVYARYNSHTKTIYINFQNINERLENITKEYFPNKLTSPTSKYIFFILLLLHETMHAMQDQKVTIYKEREKIEFLDKNFQFSQKKENNDIENIILYSEFNSTEKIITEINPRITSIIKGLIKLTIYKLKYIKLYEYIPSEKLAYIDSSQITYNLALQIDNEEASIILLLQKYLSYLDGYNIGIIRHKSDEPTKYYLDKIGTNENWHNIKRLSENLSPIEKIRLGLKVNPEELEQMSKKYKQLILNIKK